MKEMTTATKSRMNCTRSVVKEGWSWLWKGKEKMTTEDGLRMNYLKGKDQKVILLIQLNSPATILQQMRTGLSIIMQILCLRATSLGKMWIIYTPSHKMKLP